LGSFRPEGDSQYWDDKFEAFTGKISDFEDTSLGVDYLLNMTPQLSLMFTGSGYEGQADQAYRRFQDTRGNDIVHTTTLEINTATVGLVFHLLPPDAA